ncbi:MAG TPA: tetratricopeptide repeat protein [Blastocatellia bacterium]|nr:tetratricopeptide repeat protein [Blastocatellia bacterium]
MPLRFIVFIVVLTAALLAGRAVLNDFIGQALIEYGDSDVTREAAVAFAPGNPEVLSARGRYLLNRAEPARPAQAVADLERAVAISPRDYRYHVELSRAYEMNGETARAEQSLQRAVELAPRYFETRWALANLRLRAGKSDEAIADFRAALELSGGFACPPHQDAVLSAYSAITQAMGPNLEALRKVTPADTLAQTFLAGFLASTQGQAGIDAALDLWRHLPQDNAHAWRRLTFQLLAYTQNANRFTDARELWQSLIRREGIESASDDNLMTNPGFEQQPVGERYQGYDNAQAGFDWVFAAPHPQVRARRDSAVARSGAQSLHLTFNSVMRAEFQHVSQLISVEPARSYRLSFFVRTERMPENGPFVELTDAAQPGLFALRAVVPGGSSNWREVSLAFTTLPGTHALRLVIRCPLLTEFSGASPGELWLDDFRLEETR